jgi:hypothetical protein
MTPEDQELEKLYQQHKYQSESIVYKLSALTKHLTMTTPRKLIMKATDTKNAVFHKLALSYMISQVPSN